ncbi:MAG TPA: M20/M25/M40 family metallo-hydrolase [Solirubrobacteraceae bacterium]
MTDIRALLTELVRSDSTNPELVPGGAGEGGVARIVARVLEGAGFEVEVDEIRPGRPNVIGRLRGTGGGPSLMLCSHMDVVGAPPAMFEPVVADGRMVGRGASDMKSGLAASLVAAEQIAAGPRPAGDLLVSGVIDEEWESLGALAIARSHPVDAVILPEQTNLDIVDEHGGFGWYDVEVRGVEVAGIEADRGIDTIALLAPVLQGIADYDAELRAAPRPPYGRPSVHASTIAGGTQYPAYPVRTVLGIERCTVPGEQIADTRTRLEQLLAGAHGPRARFDAELRTVVERDALALDPGGRIVPVLRAAAAGVLGAEPAIRGDMGWMDSGVLVEAGIPCVIFGPTGGGEHGPGEWVELESVQACADVLAATARAFCGTPSAA